MSEVKIEADAVVLDDGSHRDAAGYASLGRCLLGVSTSDSSDDHQQTHPAKPTQLLIEKE